MLYNNLRNHISRYVAIDDNEFDEISKAFKVNICPAKTYILKKGQFCNFVAYINKGCLESYIRVGKKEQIVNFPIEGRWVGDVYSLLNRTTTTLNLKTLEDTELLVLGKNDFIAIIKNHFNFFIYILMIQHEAYIKANEQYALALSQSVEERYNNLVNHAPDFINRIPDKYLASYLGVQPPSLSRIKRKRLNKIS